MTDETTEQETIETTPPEISAADAALEKRLAEPLLKGDKGIDKAQVAVSAFLIVVVGFAAYSNVFGIPFHVEDQQIICDNTALHSFLTFPASLNAQSPGPLTMFTLAVNWWIAPGNAAFFHAINLLLHLANGVLIFLLCRRLLGQSVPESVAMLSGMIFVVHPLATESVDYAVGRGALLATFLVLGALLFFLRATRDSGEISGGALAASVFLFVLAWGADRSALITPLLILLLDRTQHDSRTMRKRLLIHAPYWAVLIALLGFEAALGTPSPSSASPPPFLSLIIPYDLSVAYAATSAEAATLVVLLVAAVIGGTLMLLSPAPGFGVWWIILGLHFGSIGSASVSERSAYGALAGLAILLPWAFSLLKIPPLRVAAGLAATMLVLAAGYATHARNAVWQDPIALWGDAVDKDPGSLESVENLGNAFLSTASTLQNTPGAKDYAAMAEQYLRKASKMMPEKSEIALNLGLALAYQKRGDEAVAQWVQALRLNPKSRPAALYLALLFDEQANATGNNEDRVRALDYFKRTDHLEPLSGVPLGQYGKALMATGDLDAAEPILARAVQGDDQSPLAPLLKYVQENVKQIRAMEQQAAARLKSAPDDPDALKTTAQTAALRGLCLKAAYILDPLFRKSPQDFGDWVLMGYVRARMDEAAQFLGEWPAPPPKPSNVDSAWKALALACAGSGLWTAAAAYIETPGAIAENGPPLLALADIATRLKNPQRVRDYLEQTAAADPANPTPWLRLCDRAIEDKDMSAAAQCLNEAQSRNADPSEIAARRSRLSPALPTAYLQK